MEPCLQPTQQGTAILDPSPTEWGQGSNPCPQGYESDSLPLSHRGNSQARDGLQATEATCATAAAAPDPLTHFPGGWGLNIHLYCPPSHCRQLLLFFFLSFIFGTTLTTYGSSYARGRIGNTAAGLRHSHSNTRILTHWERPGIEPASSQSLCCVLRLLSHNGNTQFYFI